MGATAGRPCTASGRAPPPAAPPAMPLTSPPATRLMLSLALLLSGMASLNAWPPSTISFERDIQPILSEHCFICHGPDAQRRQADLRLDTEAGLRGVLGSDTTHSELMVRVTSDDPDLIMPPPTAGEPLTAQQIGQLRAWIAEGAPWDVHWSYRTIVRPPLPEVHDGALLRNPIDQLVQAKLWQDLQQMPAPEATRAQLIRRVTLDLTGLPPDPTEVQSFLDDPRPDAYEQLVERLLASPAFGERAAWDWLDAARYADSNGYQGDSDRTMWPWRDWTLRAINQNLPFHEFTTWQLAGDLLPQPTPDQILATGFCRNHAINGEGGRIPEENRVDYVMDMTETMGTIWLGLTLNCCRCHDHKFDPLTRRDYYQLFAFFNQTPIDGGGGNPQTPPVLEMRDSQRDAQLAQLQAWIEAKTGQLEQLDGPARATATQERDAKQAELDSLRKQIPRVMVMADAPMPRETFMLERGLYSQRGELVSAGVPGQLPSWPDQAPTNRLGLATWLTDRKNPLTARVMVNRYWQQCFDWGLVKTTEDFGVQGDRPLQRELLDWLAAEFIDSNWDVKHLWRLMVTSHTYRQSSRISSPEAYERDPDNRYLARGVRRRLPAWMLRDQALAVSGLLVQQLGGPPTHPYQPPGVWEEATFGRRQYVQDHGAQLYRRSLYTFWRRIVAPTMFFDNASRQVCTVNRFRTNTPLHALTTLNDITYVEASRGLAIHALQTPHTDDRTRLNSIFWRVLAREASPEEATILLRGLNRTRELYGHNQTAAEQLLAVGEWQVPLPSSPVEAASWTNLCLTVLNMDEALSKE